MKEKMLRCKIGDLLIERREKIDRDSIDQRGIPIISKIGFSEGQIEVRSSNDSKTPLILVYPGDIVLSGINASKGAIAIFDTNNKEPIAATIHYSAYHVNEEKANSKFLWWFLRSNYFREISLETVSGGIKTELKSKKFLQIEINIPSLKEQNKILHKVEHIHQKFLETSHLRHQAIYETDELFQNKMRAVFQKLSEIYPVKTFGSLSVFTTSGPRYWAKHYNETGYRFYRAQDIGLYGKTIDESKIYVSPPSGDQGKTAMLQPGDLMIVITGATVGRVGLFQDNHESGFVSQHVAICRLPNDIILPSYALWGLLSPEGQSQLIGQRYGQGKPGLNLNNIRNLQLPIPSIKEQIKVIQYFETFHNKINSLRKLQSETSEEILKLMPSFQNKAIKGEL